MNPIARYDVLPCHLKFLIVGAIGVILIPIIAGLVIVCILIASVLGMIDRGRSSSRRQAIAKVDLIPDLSENPASRIMEKVLRTETDIERKRRLEIEIDFLEERLHARRDKFAQVS
ncbi:hypothetical protein ACN38_g6339 [Penicillium nordicum]|uniref:Uncharacterized protein n=1 Tax=Penicillium nordicum TaxID=229535 RepID=A0A0M8P8A0_9EURO|nr:hypothetical protein ACN38_g6339 [Penicillium nordicum]